MKEFNRDLFSQIVDHISSKRFVFIDESHFSDKNFVEKEDGEFAIGIIIHMT